MRLSFTLTARWARILTAVTVGFLAAACQYESDIALHHQSEAVRPPELVGDAWDGNCQRLGEAQACLFPIEGHPEWLAARLSGESGYSYYAFPRRHLASIRPGADGVSVLLSPREKRVFVERRELDIALGNLILMFEAMDGLPDAERCRVTVDALPFQRPQSWACE